MPMKSPQDVAKKWSRNAGQAVADMKKSIEQLTVNPMEMAAQSGAAYIAGVQEAFSSGRWEAGLRKVPVSEWKQRFITIGLPRYQEGAQKNEAKMAAFMSKFLPQVEQIKAQVRAMPKASKSERIQRMLANVEMMSNLKGSFS